MDGYKKVPLRNHKGEILLPQTTASMVSEESDRRFVDNLEKTILNKLAINGVAIDELVSNYEALSALSKEQLSILALLDTIPNDLEEWGIKLNSLSELIPFIDQLLGSIGATTTINSITSGEPYFINVDDSDPDNPKIVLSLATENESQPSTYVVGDLWTVPETAPDIKISVPASAGYFYNQSNTIIQYEEATSEIEKGILEDLINKVEDIEISSTGDYLPQAIIKFNIIDFLKSMFNKDDLEKTIKRFNLSILTKPISSSSTKTYMYSNRNVIQPVRNNTVKSQYEESAFTHLTWGTELTQEFIEEMLNKDKTIALNVSGVKNSSISVTGPSLEIYIENPYKGKTLEAINDKSGDFNILDWKVQE